MNGNGFISWLLQSPLHGLLSKGMLLITVTGKRTGRTYTLPVGYYESGGYLWILTSRNRTWWRNLRDGASVTVNLKRRHTTGFAHLETDEDAVSSRLAEYIRFVPQAAKPMGIRMEESHPNPVDLVRVAKDRLFVRLKVESA